MRNVGKAAGVGAEPSAYFWIRETPKSQAEVDYIVQVGTRVVPVEVKSGTTFWTLACLYLGSRSKFC